MNQVVTTPAQGAQIYIQIATSWIGSWDDVVKLDGSLLCQPTYLTFVFWQSRLLVFSTVFHHWHWQYVSEQCLRILLQVHNQQS